MAKVNYREGDWFGIPLRDHGHAVGVISRANPDGVLLGYFFGPRRADVPTLDDVADLRRGEAVLVCRFGHLGLKQGRWPILGLLPEWDRAEWPTPVFVRDEELAGRSFDVYYDDDDPNRPIREESAIAAVGERGPEDGLMGPGFVELRLTAEL